MESNTAAPVEEASASNNLRPITHHITTHSPETYETTVHSSNLPSWVPLGSRNRLSLLYSTSATRPSLNTEKDIHDHYALTASPNAELRLAQPNGTAFCIMDIAPDSQPRMHRTNSLDYVSVVAGELELIMEDGQKRLCGSGDVIVQRGTKHAWRNPSTVKWARLMAVIIECEEVEFGGGVLE